MGMTAPTREMPYRASHRRSQVVRADRIRSKPATLRGLLRWAQREYRLETPNLDHIKHDRELDDMGDPQMRHNVQRYLGLEGRANGPDDWTAIACHRDKDGSYVSPLRCAIKLIALDNSERGAFLRALVEHDSHESDIPDWAVGDVAFHSLSILWDRYAQAPLPTRKWTELSESQQNAIEAA